MTVSYQYEVASSTSGGFTRLLFMWRGSLYKLIYRELLLFIVSFGLLSAAYRNLFTDPQKRLFEKVVVYCETFITYIPLSFVLGFYVAYVASRWWQQYLAIPWPDKVMHSLALYVSGNDVQGRMIRRTLMRYLNLSLILVLRSISSAVKRRFPTMDHLVESGFMTRLELEMFQAVPSLEFNTYWIPCTWFIALLKDSKQSNRIVDSQGLQTVVQEFNEYRSKCGLLWSYDWISIPLVYTQVVTLATYSFFLAALVGRQYVHDTTSLTKKQFQMEVDIYIPLFTILQFFFYMGLLKVAEQLINPFGDDDEDFELNWLIDRHTKVSYLGVDTLMTTYPPLVKDKYFDEINLVLPYTGAAFAYKKKTYRGSVHNMQVPEDQQSMFLPEISEEDEEDLESCKRGSTPKKTTSFTNLMNAVSPSAGIWRASFEKPSETSNEDVEASVEQVEIRPQTTLNKFYAKAPWKARSAPMKIPLSPPTFPGPDLHRWESHSTLDSVDSIPANAESSPDPRPGNPFDSSFEQAVQQPVTCLKRFDSAETIKPSRSSVPSVVEVVAPNSSKIFKYSSTGNIASSLKNSFSKHFKGNDRSAVMKMLGRRQSSASGQWKGVRWKPVIDDSAGDIWSDNANRRNSRESTAARYGQSSSRPTSPRSAHSDVSSNATSSFHSLTDNDLPEEFEHFEHNTRRKYQSRSVCTVWSYPEKRLEHRAKEVLRVSSLPDVFPSYLKANLTLPSQVQTLHLGRVLQQPSPLPDPTSPRILPNKLQ